MNDCNDRYIYIRYTQVYVQELNAKNTFITATLFHTPISTYYAAQYIDGENDINGSFL